MEDLVGEGLELAVTVDFGVCGPIRGCCCLAAKDWRVFVGVVIAAFCLVSNLLFELAFEALGDGLV